MKKINLNQLAKDVAEREGGKQNVSIAQIKEVIRITLTLLAEQPGSVALEAIERHRPETKA